MPFLALPYEKRSEKDALSRHFEVSGIPTLVILDPSGNVINTEARGAVGNDPDGEKFPWPPPLVWPLDECSAINTDPVVTILAEACSTEVVTALEATATAVAEKLKAEGAESPIVWALASPGDDLASKIRSLCSLPEATETPVVVLIDLQDDKAFYTFEGGDPTEEGLGTFVAGFQAKALEKKSLRM